MRIKALQLNEERRKTLARAVDHYKRTTTTPATREYNELEAMHQQIEHGEVIVCEYVYNGKEGAKWS